MHKYSILIPHHHRIDLLLPLLTHLKHFPVLVVDDGPTQGDWNLWEEKHSRVECIRAKGSSGFTNAVNTGLNYLEEHNVEFVLILNDDAWIELDSIKEIFTRCSPNQIISPVIQVNDEYIFGVQVSKFGRIKLQSSSLNSINALIGPCLCIPADLRLDNRFFHGFEDIALTYWAFNNGYTLTVLDEHVCIHQQGGTVPPLSLKGIRYSIYGHLQVYDSLMKTPVIWASYVVLIAKMNGSSIAQRIQLLNSINQGVLDWVCSAIEVRMASSRLGSNNAR